jgi:hypothetical protein
MTTGTPSSWIPGRLAASWCPAPVSGEDVLFGVVFALIAGTGSVHLRAARTEQHRRLGILSVWPHLLVAAGCSIRPKTTTATSCSRSSAAALTPPTLLIMMLTGHFPYRQEYARQGHTVLT